MVRFRKPQHMDQTNNSDTYEYYYNNEDDEEDSLLPEDLDSILTDKKNVPLDTIPSSTTVLVNRKYLLPSTYIPKNLVVPNVDFNFSYVNDKRKMRKIAANALEKLFAAAKKDGVELYGISGYRSYARQKEIYDRNVAIRGKAATDAVSAMPGSSEHQTGLTIDVSAKSVGYRLDQSFGDTKEGKWLAKHCHEYGFIIRYPYGKEKITGYSYEPWHIRYVGISIAGYLYKNDLTLEEYYGVTMENEKVPENSVDVEDPDSVVYATPKPTKKPKEEKEDKKEKKIKRPDIVQNQRKQAHRLQNRLPHRLPSSRKCRLSLPLQLQQSRRLPHLPKFHRPQKNRWQKKLPHLLTCQTNKRKDISK